MDDSCLTCHSEWYHTGLFKTTYFIIIITQNFKYLEFIRQIHSFQSARLPNEASPVTFVT